MKADLHIAVEHRAGPLEAIDVPVLVTRIHVKGAWASEE
jgi:hypothetical protein